MLISLQTKLNSSRKIAAEISCKPGVYPLKPMTKLFGLTTECQIILASEGATIAICEIRLAGVFSPAFPTQIQCIRRKRPEHLQHSRFKIIICSSVGTIFTPLTPCSLQSVSCTPHIGPGRSFGMITMLGPSGLVQCIPTIFWNRVNQNRLRISKKNKWPITSEPVVASRWANSNESRKDMRGKSTASP